MPKRKIKKKIVKKKLNFKKLLFFLPMVLLVAVGVVGYMRYQSRSIPDVGDESGMTVLPSPFQHVLGAQTSPQGPQTISLRIPIFMYHYVESNPTDGREKYNIPPSILTAQIETLKAAGYTFINTDDLTTGVLGRKKLPQKVIMLTFDDGYIDMYTDVLPILQKENVKAVAYIVPSFLDRPHYLFTSQLEALAKSPLVEIGAHTMDHYALAGMNTKEATYEIAQSRKTLQDLLHLPIRAFAYPYGSFDQQTVQIVKDAGFTSAVSVVPGIMQSPENMYYFFRLRPGYRSGQVLLDYLKQDTFQPW